MRRMRTTIARGAGFVFATTCAVTACTVADDPPTSATGNSPTVGLPSGETGDGGGTVTADATSDASVGSTLDGARDANVDAGLVQQLLQLTSHCSVASNGKYAEKSGAAPTVDVCRLNGAYFWKSGMQIDCDGQRTNECNPSTAPNFTPQTSFTQSNNQPLVSAQLSFYVIPLPSSRFNYKTAGIRGGAVGIVIVNGVMRYGVFGDEGVADVIGSASYAMASHLGVNPSPTTGGVDSGVTYIVFTGGGAVASPIEDHSAANALGATLVATLLQNN